VYGGHSSVQRIERSQTAQVRRGTRRVYGSVGSREGRYDFEVLRVESVTRDERYRVRPWRRSEELMPEVREFCIIMQRGPFPRMTSLGSAKRTWM